MNTRTLRTYPNVQYRNKETWQKILSANFLGDTLYIYGIIHETIYVMSIYYLHNLEAKTIYKSTRIPENN